MITYRNKIKISITPNGCVVPSLPHTVSPGGAGPEGVRHAPVTDDRRPSGAVDRGDAGQRADVGAAAAQRQRGEVRHALADRDLLLDLARRLVELVQRAAAALRVPGDPYRPSAHDGRAIGPRRAA